MLRGARLAEALRGARMVAVRIDSDLRTGPGASLDRLAALEAEVAAHAERIARLERGPVP
jgi:hypothetical protein